MNSRLSLALDNALNLFCLIVLSCIASGVVVISVKIAKEFFL